MLYYQLLQCLTVLMCCACCYGIGRKGIIATLSKGFDDPKLYQSSLMARNIAIEKYLYKNSTNVMVDIVIFHEGNIPLEHQKYINNFTPNMPLIFVDVSRIFKLYKHVNNPQCPPTARSSKKQPGYFSMCYFWFTGFQEYVTSYDWIFRIDDDCVISENSRSKLYKLPDSFHFSSAYWQDLSLRDHYDHISAINNNEGDVVKGMRNVTSFFAMKHQLNLTVHSWFAPYTNIMLINLNWWRGNVIIQDFIHFVVDTGCIYSNRWGDLPLIGAALYLVREPKAYLHIPYLHKSHQKLINSDASVDKVHEALCLIIGNERCKYFYYDLYQGTF